MTDEGAPPPPHLTPEVSDRGLRYLPTLSLPDGQFWRTYTSSDAMHASVWTAIDRDRDNHSHTTMRHLTVEEVWEYAATLERAYRAGENVAIFSGMASSTVPATTVGLIVDQLRWVVEHHHWGDMRPKVLTPAELSALLRRVRGLGNPDTLSIERSAAIRADARDLIECVDELEELLRG